MITHRPTFTPVTVSLKPQSTSEPLAVIQGQLPGRALNLVHEWGMIHRDELLQAWQLCRENRLPAKIEPLV